MAQEDYFSNSEFGQLAGALLAKNEDKDKVEKAILAQIIESGITRGAQSLKQSVIDGSTDVANKWKDAIASMTSDYDNASSDRQDVQDYKQNPNRFLLKKAIENIDLITEGKNFTYATRFSSNVTEQQRKDLDIALNQEKEDLKVAMDLKLQDPKLTINNKVDYLNPAIVAFREADKAVINDPTKRNLITSAWNRFVNTERNAQGELVTTNAKKLKLINDAEIAENVYLNQQALVDNAELALETHYGKLLNKSLETFKSDDVINTLEPVSAAEKREQIKLNNDVLYKIENGKTVPNNEYWEIPHEVNLNTGDSENPQTVDIKKFKFANIKIIDENGEINNYSEQEFLQDVSTRQVRIRKTIEKAQQLNNSNITPDVGVLSFEGALDAFANEGRFVSINSLNNENMWKSGTNILGYDYEFGKLNPNTVLFIRPGVNILKDQEINVSDLTKDAEEKDILKEEEKNNSGDGGDDPIEYNSISIETMLKSKEFINSSPAIRDREINTLVKEFPDNAKEITQFYNSYKEKGLYDNKKNNNTEVKSLETNTPVKSLLSSDNIYRTPSEIRADDSLSDIQKEDELSKRSRDELKTAIKSIPSKLKERKLNQTKEKINDFLSGKKSYFYSSTYNNWKRENNIKENYSTPKEEKQENVKQFLEFLNQ